VPPRPLFHSHLARALEAKTLDLEALMALDDELVYQQLTRIHGIGTWIANIYLLMALTRPDVWPTGDLALVISLNQLYGLLGKSQEKERQKIITSWQPWRAVAARLLWQYDLHVLR
jgi:DNA-3-methyladenine glycosylase II